jgi:hypothetical protein
VNLDVRITYYVSLKPEAVSRRRIDNTKHYTENLKPGVISGAPEGLAIPIVAPIMLLLLQTR